MIVLESFDKPQHMWFVKNDPVMGGKSVGNLTFQNDLGHFQGEVVGVPFLHAPGFLQAWISTRQSPSSTLFPDVPQCRRIQIDARTNAPYERYRVSFGNAHAHGRKFFA